MIEINGGLKREEKAMVMTTEQVWQEFHPKLKQFVLKRIPDEQSGEDIPPERLL